MSMTDAAGNHHDQAGRFAGRDPKPQDGAGLAETPDGQAAVDSFTREQLHAAAVLQAAAARASDAARLAAVRNLVRRAAPDAHTLFCVSGDGTPEYALLSADGRITGSLSGPVASAVREQLQAVSPDGWDGDPAVSGRRRYIPLRTPWAADVAAEAWGAGLTPKATPGGRAMTVFLDECGLGGRDMLDGELCDYDGRVPTAMDQVEVAYQLGGRGDSPEPGTIADANPDLADALLARYGDAEAAAGKIVDSPVWERFREEASGHVYNRGREAVADAARALLADADV